MNDEAEQAWELWAEEHPSHFWLTQGLKDAFIAGFAAGAEAYLKFLKDAKQEGP